MTKKLFWTVLVMWIIIVTVNILDKEGNLANLISGLLTFPSIVLLVFIPFVYFRSRKLKIVGQLESNYSTVNLIGYIIAAFVVAFLFVALIFSTI